MTAKELGTLLDEFLVRCHWEKGTRQVAVEGKAISLSSLILLGENFERERIAAALAILFEAECPPQFREAALPYLKKVAGVLYRELPDAKVPPA